MLANSRVAPLKKGGQGSDSVGGKAVNQFVRLHAMGELMHVDVPDHRQYFIGWGFSQMQIPLQGRRMPERLHSDVIASQFLSSLSALLGPPKAPSYT
jgi:hypothetical protein